MNARISYRKAALSDIPVIRDLASRIWREHYPGIITHAQIDYMLERMYAEDVVLNEMKDDRYAYVLVLKGDAPVGFFSCIFERPGQAVKISKLYLLPELHSLGIGRRMLRYVKDKALRSGAKKIYLFVNKRNIKAIRAYERFGMVRAAQLVTDIGGGFVMDDYRMDLDLRKP
jgi:GNAT superfamily N-acetyltransferase